MTGLVISGKPIPVHGLQIENWLDDPALRLDASDMRKRTQGEAAWIHLIVLHTTRGIPGGTDNRPQVVRPGFGVGRRAQDTVKTWTLEDRGAGAHLIVQQDGVIACCADLRTEAAYHAGTANGPSIGIEIVQGGDAELYQGQLDTTVLLVDALTRIFGIQRQITHQYLGPIARFERSLDDVVGIVGHRDLTGRRGAGDPGNAIMNLLGLAGYEPMNFGLPDDGEGDKSIWRRRQRDNGIDPADGVAGLATRTALAALGYPGGMFVPRPGDQPESGPVSLTT